VKEVICEMLTDALRGASGLADVATDLDRKLRALEAAYREATAAVEGSANRVAALEKERVDLKELVTVLWGRVDALETAIKARAAEVVS
jgi:hypothetical protein